MFEFCPAGQTPGAPIIPNVRNEFGTLKTAVVSGCSSPEILAVADTSTIAEAAKVFTDPNEASDDIRAHFAFTQLLRARAVRLLYPHLADMTPTLENQQDFLGHGLYCRDLLGVVDNHGILATLSEFREDERSRYQNILERLPPSAVSDSDGLFTWGNALLYGDSLLVGLEHDDYFDDVQPYTEPGRFALQVADHERKRRGIDSIKAILGQRRSPRQMVVIPKNSNEDLDFGIAPLPRRSRREKRKAIVRPDLLHSEAADALYSQFDDLMMMPDPRETMGCNILWLDPETPVVSAEAVQTVILLRLLGFNPIAMPLGSLMDSNKGDLDPGGWRCMTGVLERANDYNAD